MKLRPVLLLTGSLGSVPEVLVAYISSVVPAQLLPSDLLVDPAKPEFRNTHLKVTSALRLHKLATISLLKPGTAPRRT
jgi:mRNA interferase MazF